MLLIRLVCTAYWLLLSLLLLVPNPASLFYGLRRVEAVAPSRGVHLTAFTILSLLVHACRFRLPRAALWGLLLAYAAAIESLQWFVPPRSVEWADFAENVLGLALGALLFAAIEALCKKRQQCR